MQATWFMRQPFFVTGYEVTSSNMNAIAKWCEGHVITDADRPFIRVPVNRAVHTKQTEAYVGTWVLLSTQRGQRSFKVYTPEWLAKNFFRVDNEIPRDEILDENIVEIPDEMPEGKPEGILTKDENQTVSNIRQLQTPTLDGTKAIRFFSPTSATC